MNIVIGVRRWSVLILVSALAVTVPLTEARGGSRGSGSHSGGHGGGSHGSWHGYGGFRSGVVVEFGGWWNPWRYGGYAPYGWGAPGYYGYPGYPYGGYDSSYAYPPAEPPPVTYQAPPAPSFWMPTDPRAAAGSASLQIEVTPRETEILVDGARVGMAKEFTGPVTVPVAAGAHALEFRAGGLTIVENIAASSNTTVLIKRDFGTAMAPR